MRIVCAVCLLFTSFYINHVIASPVTLPVSEKKEAASKTEVMSSLIENSPKEVVIPEKTVSIGEAVVIEESVPSVEEEKEAAQEKVPDQPQKELPREKGEGPAMVIDVDAMDIVGEPQGNWLLKRYWWQKAERLYETIAQMVEKALDLRFSFDAKRNELDRNLFIPFYRKVGITQGELMEIISSLVDRIEEGRLEEGQLSVDEREFLAILEKEKSTLDQLQQNITALTELDNAIDDATIKLAEQLNLCRSYLQQARDSLQEIKRELSDKNARELYYSMDALAKNVNDIYQYTMHQFTFYFNQLITQAKEQVERITQSVDILKEKGINLKKELQALNLREMEKEAAEAEESIPKSVEKEKISGWFSSFSTSVFDWIFSFFGAKKNQ